jgi:amidohydrolase
MNPLPRHYLASLVQLRRALHRKPELSGREENTPRIVEEFMSRFSPDAVVRGLGGCGLAVVFEGRSAGPTVLIRAELDALPIDEPIGIPHRSENPGVGHKCGHDGHMAIVAGLAGLLHRRPPASGRVILLFQPAEETGEGGPRTVADPRLAALRPDSVFALHNLPGHPFGMVFTRSGVMTCASTGLIIRLAGKSAHASRPHEGISPAAAMCTLAAGLPDLPPQAALDPVLSMATVVHARLGRRGFGTAPGDAEVHATLRAGSDADLQRLKRAAVEAAAASAETDRLAVRFQWPDRFDALVNDAGAVRTVTAAAAAAGRPVVHLDRPYPWSEDFAAFTARYPGALFALGAGENVPPLHSPEYDFPDALIEPGLAMFLEIIDLLLSEG